MNENESQDSSSPPICDDREDEELDPFEDAEAFDAVLEEAVFNEKLSQGIDRDSHNVGRIYRAEASATLQTAVRDDGSKETRESNDLTAHWVDQGYYRCHTCELNIQNKAIAFIHASEHAPALVENLPPAVRADTSDMASLEEFSQDVSPN